MSTTAVGQCPHCAAVINRHWTACLVCHADLSPTAEPSGKSLAAPLPTLHPGSFVAWRRGDGSKQEGFVDCLYTDHTGTPWAFVTLWKTWAVVNLKFVKGSDEQMASEQNL